MQRVKEISHLDVESEYRPGKLVLLPFSMKTENHIHIEQQKLLLLSLFLHFGVFQIQYVNI